MSSDPFASPAGDPPAQPGLNYGPQPGYGQPPYGQAPYGQPMYGQPMYGQPYGYGNAGRNGMGVAALILGIASIVLSETVVVGIVGGLLAIIFGIKGRGRANRGEATKGGLALAGAITGVFGIIFGAGFLALYIHFGGSLSQLGRCDQAAHGDQQQIQLCNDQFQNQLNN